MNCFYYFTLTIRYCVTLTIRYCVTLTIRYCVTLTIWYCVTLTIRYYMIPLGVWKTVDLTHIVTLRAALRRQSKAPHMERLKNSSCTIRGVRSGRYEIDWAGRTKQCARRRRSYYDVNSKTSVSRSNHTAGVDEGKKEGQWKRARVLRRILFHWGGSAF